MGRIWDLPKPSNKPLPRFWRIERVSWRYNFTEDKYILQGTTTPYNSLKSKMEAHRILDRIEQDALQRLSDMDDKCGQYAVRSSTDDLHVCIYGNKFHFRIQGI